MTSLVRTFINDYVPAKPIPTCIWIIGDFFLFWSCGNSLDEMNVPFQTTHLLRYSSNQMSSVPFTWSCLWLESFGFGMQLDWQPNILISSWKNNKFMMLLGMPEGWENILRHQISSKSAAGEPGMEWWNIGSYTYTALQTGTLTYCGRLSNRSCIRANNHDNVGFNLTLYGTSAGWMLFALRL